MSGKDLRVTPTGTHLCKHTLLPDQPPPHTHHTLPSRVHTSCRHTILPHSHEESAQHRRNTPACGKTPWGSSALKKREGGDVTLLRSEKAQEGVFLYLFI